MGFFGRVFPVEEKESKLEKYKEELAFLDDQEAIEERKMKLEELILLEI